MFKTILVPLDGSEYAERALEPAFNLAKKFGGEVILLRVVVPEEILVSLPRLVPRYYDWHSPVNGYALADAQAYLAGVSTQWGGSHVPIRTEVFSGTPAEMIVAAAQELKVDMIVMSTHGRSGFSRLIYGSVAEAVLRGAHLPVLLVPLQI